MEYSEAAAPLIQGSGLSITRGIRPLFEHLDFQLHAGEAVQVCGPNGCGKTSLLEALAGLRPPDSGVLHVPPLTDSIWIGHRHGFAPELPAAENLALWCDLHGVENPDIEAAMRYWQVPRARRRALGALSAGQQQRTALATTELKKDARLWLLDEPIAALDTEAVERLSARIRAFCEGGGAVVLTTHQPIQGLTPRRVELKA
ncbi:heme ABC exporter ATP-binding protein CcmA [Algiphilus sp.]|uniref:heme ABC exporter ATP-binding protein CcmA n=1 Tax=Algiphilus sp. TaxID=1872431 RepID=UPI003B5215A6